MFNVEQFVQLIIKPSIESIDKYSKSAENLLLITSSESNGGTYFKQIKGPALGIYQMEPNTYHDIWTNWLAFRKPFAKTILDACGYIEIPNEEALIYNLKYATIIARVHYLRVKEPIPDAKDFGGLIEYYYKYWGPNPDKTSLDKASNHIKTLFQGRI